MEKIRLIAFGHIRGRLFACVYVDRGSIRRIISLRKANSREVKFMAKKLSKAAAEALAATDWSKLDRMTDAEIARQIAADPDAAPDMAPAVDVRAIRRAAGMTQAEFAAAYRFSVRTVQEWERGAKRPSGPARTLLRAIKADPEGLRRALAAA
jgi:putative transcriptional regulator